MNRLFVLYSSILYNTECNRRFSSFFFFGEACTVLDMFKITLSLRLPPGGMKYSLLISRRRRRLQTISIFNRHVSKQGTCITSTTNRAISSTSTRCAIPLASALWSSFVLYHIFSLPYILHGCGFTTRRWDITGLLKLRSQSANHLVIPTTPPLCLA